MVNLKDNVITLTKEELYKNIKDKDILDKIPVKKFTKEQAKQSLINELAELNYIKKKGPDTHMFGEYFLNKRIDNINYYINDIIINHNLKIEIDKETKSITIVDKDTIYMIEKVSDSEETKSKVEPKQEQEEIKPQLKQERQQKNEETKSKVEPEQQEKPQQEQKEIKPKEQPQPLNTAINQKEFTNKRIISAIDKIANGDYRYVDFVLNNITKEHKQEAISCINQLRHGNTDVNTFKLAMMGVLENNLTVNNSSNIVNNYQEPFIILDGDTQYVDPYGNTLYKFSDGSLKYYTQLTYKDIDDINKRNNGSNGLDNLFSKINDDVRPIVKLSMEEIALHNPQVMQQMMMNQQPQQMTQQPTLDDLLKQAGLPDTYKVLDPDSINEIIRLNESKNGSTVMMVTDKLLSEGLIPIIRHYMGKTEMVSMDINNHRMYIDIYGMYYDPEEKILFQIGYNVYGFDPENDIDVIVKYLKNEISDNELINESFVDNELLELNAKVNLATFPVIEDRYGFFNKLSKIFKNINTHGKQFQCIKGQFKNDDKFMLARTEDINNLKNIIRCLQITKSKVEIKDVSKEEFVKL